MEFLVCNAGNMNEVACVSYVPWVEVPEMGVVLVEPICSGKGAVAREPFRLLRSVRFKNAGDEKPVLFTLCGWDFLLSDVRGLIFQASDPWQKP